MRDVAPDLARFFSPRSIAIVGVPREANRFGGMSFLHHLVDAAFPGKLFPINPKAEEILGFRSYPSLSCLPERPDLTIVCVPAAHVPEVLDECGRNGLRHIHILTSGFKEIGTEEGRRLEDRIAAIAGTHGLLVIGPNCMGPYCPASRLTAWGASPGKSGPVGIISQSGGITQRLTEYLCSLGIGVAKAVSFGNGTVLDSTDFLAYMAEDPEIRVIAMYLEGVERADRFRALAQRVAREKPMVLLKGGASEAGARTASSHTGNMAGDSDLWEAFSRQTGMVWVRSLDEWVDAILALCFLPEPEGNGLFLIGGGGGNSVIYGDTCEREGMRVPALSRGTMEKLRGIVPEAGSIAGNPLDLWMTFLDPSCLGRILDLAMEDPAVHMVMVDRLIPRKIYHMPEVEDPTPRFVKLLLEKRPGKPVVMTLDSEGGDPELSAKGAEIRASFCKAGIPAYPSVQRAARALRHRWRCRRPRAS